MRPPELEHRHRPSAPASHCPGCVLRLSTLSLCSGRQTTLDVCSISAHFQRCPFKDAEWETGEWRVTCAAPSQERICWWNGGESKIRWVTVNFTLWISLSQIDLWHSQVLSFKHPEHASLKYEVALLDRICSRRQIWVQTDTDSELSGANVTSEVQAGWKGGCLLAC